MSLGLLICQNMTVLNVVPEARSAIRNPAQIHGHAFRLDLGSGLPAGRQARGDIEEQNETQSNQR
jgi:hypothetical protein